MIDRPTARDTLRASILDAASLFGPDADAQQPAFDRQLDSAVADMNRLFPNVVGAQFVMQADVGDYPAPEDALRFHMVDSFAELECIHPWNLPEGLAVPMPRLIMLSGVKTWRLAPKPSATLITLAGSTYRYSYVARHSLPAEDPGTLEDELLPLLILRAQVDTMRELSVRNAHKPMATRDGMYNQTRNGTPAALAALFMELFETQARVTAQTYRLGA